MFPGEAHNLAMTKESECDCEQTVSIEIYYLTVA